MTGAAPSAPGRRDPRRHDPWCRDAADRAVLARDQLDEALRMLVAGAGSDRLTARAFAMFRRRLALAGGAARLGALLGPGQRRLDAPLWGFAGLARAEFQGAAFGDDGGWCEIESEPLPADGAAPAARPGTAVLTLPVLEWRITSAVAPDWAVEAFERLTENGEPEGWAQARALDLVRDVAVATDVIAVELDPPHRWARLTGACELLGAAAVERAGGDLGQPAQPRLRLYRDPLDWWRDGNAGLALDALWPRWNHGACIAAPERAWQRHGAVEDALLRHELICDDADHAAAVHGAQQRLRKRLLAALPRPRPLRIVAPAGDGA